MTNALPGIDESAPVQVPVETDGVPTPRMRSAVGSGRAARLRHASSDGHARGVESARRGRSEVVAIQDREDVWASVGLEEVPQ